MGEGCPTMIRYELYNQYGEKVTNYSHDADNLETVIIEHEGQFYRPICYELGEPSVAKCVPVTVLNSGEDKRHDTISE